MAFQLCMVLALACFIHICHGDTETQSTAVLPPKVSDTDTAASILGPLGLLGPAGALGLLGPASPLLSTLVLSSLLGGGLGHHGLGGGLGHHGHYGHGHYHNPHASLIPLLLASTYGRYLPYGLGAYGLYGYSASNTVQNSKPFGNYKYEERP